MPFVVLQNLLKVDNVKTKDVFWLIFDVLQGTSPITSMQHLKLPENIIVNCSTECNSSGPKSWGQWWMRKQTLAKPLLLYMDSKDWDRAPHNTNGVERATYTAKT